VAVAAIPCKDMIKVCALYGVLGHSAANKLQCCQALIAYKANVTASNNVRATTGAGRAGCGQEGGMPATASGDNNSNNTVAKISSEQLADVYRAARDKWQRVSILQLQIKDQRKFIDKLEVKMAKKKTRYRCLVIAQQEKEADEEPKSTTNIQSSSLDSLLSTAQSTRTDYKRLQSEYDDARTVLDDWLAELAKTKKKATAATDKLLVTQTLNKRVSVDSSAVAASSGSTAIKRIRRIDFSADDQHKKVQIMTTTVDSNSSSGTNSDNEIVTKPPPAQQRPVVSKLFFAPKDSE
jgi:hypothetical protein